MTYSPSENDAGLLCPECRLSWLSNIQIVRRIFSELGISSEVDSFEIVYVCSWCKHNKQAILMAIAIWMQDLFLSPFPHSAIPRRKNDWILSKEGWYISPGISMEAWSTSQ